MLSECSGGDCTMLNIASVSCKTHTHTFKTMLPRPKKNAICDTSLLEEEYLRYGIFFLLVRKYNSFFFNPYFCEPSPFLHLCRRLRFAMFRKLQMPICEEVSLIF